MKEKPAMVLSYNIILCTIWPVAMCRVLRRFNSCILYVAHNVLVNPSAGELFISLFHLFKAGIADAISSFKWRIIVHFLNVAEIELFV